MRRYVNADELIALCNIMATQEWLAEQIKKLPPEEVYDLMYNIVINIGSRYNTSRGGVADWLTKQSMDEVEE